MCGTDEATYPYWRRERGQKYHNRAPYVAYCEIATLTPTASDRNRG